MLCRHFAVIGCIRDPWPRQIDFSGMLSKRFNGICWPVVWVDVARILSSLSKRVLISALYIAYWENRPCRENEWCYSVTRTASMWQSTWRIFSPPLQHICLGLTHLSLSSQTIWSMELLPLYLWNICNYVCMYMEHYSHFYQWGFAIKLQNFKTQYIITL